MPLLSICIPTFNRANLLAQTIDSIIKQDFFKKNNEIEIIISDNASTDNTQKVCEKYVNCYPDKIKYYKNSENIGFANFEKVLSLADGEFLKLQNDTLLFEDNSLEKITNYIKHNIESKNILFFLNKNKILKQKNLICNNLDEFVNKISYKS